MKKLLYLLFCLPILVWGQTDASLTTSANTIKNETNKGANTAARIGQMALDLTTAKLNVLNLNPPLYMNDNNLDLHYTLPLALSGSNLVVNQFSSSTSGIVPSSGGGSSNFLRADGTWTVPSGTLPSGSSAGQLLYYNGTIPAWNVAGSSGQVAVLSGTTPTWTTFKTINSTALTSSGNISIPVITTSSYSPSVTSVQNINTITAGSFWYQSDGSFYNLYGYFDVYPSTSGTYGNVVFDFDFPAGVTWSNDHQVIGLVSGVFTSSGTTPVSGVVNSKVGSTQVRCIFTSTNPANTYRIYINVFYHS